MLKQGARPATGTDRHLGRRPETQLPRGLGSFPAPAPPALVPGNTSSSRNSRHPHGTKRSEDPAIRTAFPGDAGNEGPVWHVVPPGAQTPISPASSFSSWGWGEGSALGRSRTERIYPPELHRFEKKEDIRPKGSEQ